MTLHFSWPEVMKALEEIKTAKTATPYYNDPVGPGLFIVGDHGIYLMPNTTDGIHHSKGEKIIVYARECDPRTHPFDRWWHAKNSTWGGDDGCEFLALDDLIALSETPTPPTMRIAALAVNFANNQMAFSIVFAPIS